MATRDVKPAYYFMEQACIDGLRNWRIAMGDEAFKARMSEHGYKLASLDAINRWEAPKRITKDEHYARMDAERTAEDEQ